jgi:ribosomal protein L22
VPATLETRTVRAQAKWVRTSARKARVVAEHIRGRSVPEARTVLAFTQRAAARELEKVLASAVANAEANHGMVGDELVVQAAVVDEGPTLKRWRARARGRVARIKKRTCHITVLLAPMAQEGLAGGETRKRAVKTEAETAEEPKAQQPEQRRAAKPASETPATARPRAKRPAGKKES